jgi:hypothetical protein
VPRLLRSRRGSNAPTVAAFSRAAVVLGVVGGVILGAVPRHARAEGPTPFRVESLPGATCASGDPFATQLLRRTNRIREAVGEERALVFRLEVTPAKARTLGRLTVRELDGSELEREVVGADCEEVVSAMVLIAAILVDPNASLDPLPSPRTEPPRPPPTAPPRPPEGAPASPDSVTPAGRSPPRGAVVRPRASIEEEARRRSASERVDSLRPDGAAGGGATLGRLMVGAGVGFALEGAPMPKLAAGIAVSGSVSLERASMLSPLVEGSAVRTQTVRVATPSGIAELRFSSLRLLACPVRFPPVGVFAIRPCAVGELGELTGTGKVTEDPALVSARWVAVGAAVRGSVRLLGPLVLVGGGALIVPLIRHEFYFDPQGPETTALSVSAFGFSTRLGMLAEFE